MKEDGRILNMDGLRFLVFLVFFLIICKEFLFCLLNNLVVFLRLCSNSFDLIFFLSNEVIISCFEILKYYKELIKK